MDPVKRLWVFHNYPESIWNGNRHEPPWQTCQGGLQPARSRECVGEGAIHSDRKLELRAEKGP